VDGYEKAERLFRAKATENITIPPDQWDETFSGVHGDDLKVVANSLRELAVKAVRMAAYMDARGGEDGVDRGHEVAVKAQNDQAEKVRALLDYAHPRDDITF